MHARKAAATRTDVFGENKIFSVIVPMAASWTLGYRPTTDSRNKSIASRLVLYYSVDSRLHVIFFLSDVMGDDGSTVILLRPFV